MIQRIQSIFLFVAAAITVALLFIPIGYIYTDEFYYVFNSFVVKLNIPDGEIYMTTFYIAIMLIASATLSIVSIFLYKNRKRQIQLVTINMFIFLITILLMLYVYPDIIFIKKGLMKPDDFFNFNYWILICIIPAICLYLANKFIKKDENLIRAADRLR